MTEPFLKIERYTRLSNNGSNKKNFVEICVISGLFLLCLVKIREISG